MNTSPTIIILVGITGDLAQRKLLPAIESLGKKELLPEHFKVVGITRRDDQPDLFKMDLQDAAEYERLARYLESIEKEWSTPAQRLFYLSVPPTVAAPIIEQLGKSGLSKMPQTKLLLEKPFGTDLEDAKKLIAHLDTYFDEGQVYRIDHYLAKKPVRALVDNVIDLSTVEKIQVAALETLTIEKRAEFYEQTGALRDFASHLLEVAALTLHPINRVELLKEFSVIPETVKRGQYKGYREAVGNPISTVETFVSLTLQSSGPIFTGTVELKTGKALHHKSTDVTIFYKDGASKVLSLYDPSLPSGHMRDHSYETVFLDVIAGHNEFFIAPAEVLETWRIIAPVQAAWKQSADDLFIYEQGSQL
jgi:glucose-6-phosphate 1-dehydrogenase